MKNMNLLHDMAEEIQQLRREINETLIREEVMWKQRSRALWMRWGDHNMKFFHAMTTQRQRHNKIEGLWGADGAWHEEKEEVEQIILEYFSEIFSTSHPNIGEASLDAVKLRISTEMNNTLLAECKEAEIKSALNQMHPTKVPRSEGMPPIFYHKYWDVVEPNVINCVLDILNSGRMLRSLNETYICLIPKVKCPQKVTDFQPISLCNIIYKIVSKVLANRLKKILPEVISEKQSAFIPERQIIDNVLVAFEIMHRINQKRNGNECQMAVKLDMSKVYDRVEWAYLEEIMRKMGFQKKWISLSMMCVKTMSFSILINGEPRGKIIPTRGLRQGDLISLYLLLLCAEGLSASFRDEVKMGKIKGVSVCRGAP